MEKIITGAIGFDQIARINQIANSFIITSGHDLLEKGGKKAELNEERTFGGKLYIKTAKGWRPKPKGTRSSESSDDGGGSGGGEPKTAEAHAKALSDQDLDLALKNAEKFAPELRDVLKSEKSRREQVKEANKNPFAEHLEGLKKDKDAQDKADGKQRLTVDQRWDAYEVNADACIDGDAKSMLAYGTGGVGKTYTIMQLLNKKGMKDFDTEKGHQPGDNSYDYVKITGKSNMTELWKSLYEHNNKLLLFDDCDGFLDNKEAVDILKGALDTSGDGTIQYKELKVRDADGEETYLPKRFKFKGRVVFITNRPAHDFESGDLQAFKSRSLMSNLTMTKEETMQKAKNIMPHLDVTDVQGNSIPNVSVKDKLAVFDFVERHIDDIDLGNLNMRTIGSAIKLYKKAQTMKKDHEPLIAPLFGLESYKASKKQ